jgi:hypothetical protein
MDLYNYLLRQRIIFLAGYVNDKVTMQDILCNSLTGCSH